jgi:hypothetical protein
MPIIGAGLSGLIAAHKLIGLPILERASEPIVNHRALLRFRTRAVSDLCGVDFKSVRVHKSIYQDGAYIGPNPRSANLYARKVIGRGEDRSIWNLEPVDRFIAPPDFQERLFTKFAKRIEFGVEYDFAAPRREAVVSTAPMPLVLRACEIKDEASLITKFERSPIDVIRFELDRFEAYQTVYFPSGSTSVYRASITGSILIIEMATNFNPPVAESREDALMLVNQAFGIDPGQTFYLDSTQQAYGKISPIDEAFRRRAILRLSREKNIYSLGRFACWRNILLDEIPSDADRISNLMRVDDYSRSITQSSWA